MAKVEINIPTVLETQNSLQPIKSFRGILKGRGITLERFREMQCEDKAIEDEADERRNKA
jgi:cytidylate kinase